VIYHHDSTTLGSICHLFELDPFSPPLTLFIGSTVFGNGTFYLISEGEIEININSAEKSFPIARSGYIEKKYQVVKVI